MSAHEFFFLLLRDPLALLLLLAFTLVPTGLLGWALYVEYRIGNEGVTVDARVTAHREHYESGTRWKGRGNKNGVGVWKRRLNGHRQYEVDYEFSPPGSHETYTPFWLHRLLMVSVSEAVYAEARETDRIAIQYVPSRPDLNRPPNCGATDRILIFFFISMGVNLLVMTGIVAASVYRATPRRAAPPRNRFAHG